MRSSQNQLEKTQTELDKTTKQIEATKRLKKLIEGRVDKDIAIYIDQIDQIADTEKKLSLASKKNLLKFYLQCLTTRNPEEIPEELTSTNLYSISEDIRKSPKESPYSKLSQEELSTQFKELLSSLEKLQKANGAWFSEIHWDEGDQYTYNEIVAKYQQKAKEGKITSQDVRNINDWTNDLSREIDNRAMLEKLNIAIKTLEIKRENINVVKDLLEQHFDTQLETYVHRLEASPDIKNKHPRLFFSLKNYYIYLSTLPTYDNLPEDLNKPQITWLFSRANEALALSANPQRLTTYPIMFAQDSPPRIPVSKVEALNALLKKYEFEIEESFLKTSYRLFIPTYLAVDPEINFFIELFKKKEIIEPNQKCESITMRGVESNFYVIRNEKLSDEKIKELTGFISLVESLPSFPHLSQPQYTLRA